MKDLNCEYDGTDISSDWTSAGNWKVYIDRDRLYGNQRPTYTYEEAKAKCNAWGATLVREQDVLDAVRLW